MVTSAQIVVQLICISSEKGPSPNEHFQGAATNPTQNMAEVMKNPKRATKRTKRVLHFFPDAGKAHPHDPDSILKRQKWCKIKLELVSKELNNFWGDCRFIPVDWGS